MLGVTAAVAGTSCYSMGTTGCMVGYGASEKGSSLTTSQISVLKKEKRGLVHLQEFYGSGLPVASGIVPPLTQLKSLIKQVGRLLIIVASPCWAMNK